MTLSLASGLAPLIARADRGPVRCSECGATLAKVYGDGVIIGAARITSTRKLRLYIDPRAVICDNCGQFQLVSNSVTN